MIIHGQPQIASLDLTECDLLRQTEAGAEHLLVRADQSDIVDSQIDLLVAAAADTILRGDGVTDALRNTLADIDVVVVFVRRVAREAVYMDLGQRLRGVRGEERLLACVDADKGVEEFDGVTGEVHHIVVEDVGAMEDLRGRERFSLFLCGGLLAPAHLGLNGHGVRRIQEGFGRPADELAAVLVEGRDELVGLVALDGVQHHLVSVRVEIIGPHEDLLAACRHCERPDARHDVADHLSWAELVH